jgi:beta-1,2-mannosidase
MNTTRAFIPQYLVWFALLGLTALLFGNCAGGKVPANEKWVLEPFKKNNDVNPIMTPDSRSEFFCPVQRKSLRWEEKDVFNPAAVVKDNRVYLLYRAQDNIGKPGGTSRIGLANSRDGLSFKKQPIPVLFPDQDPMKIFEWEGGCEDPRVVRREDGTYIMTYTAYDGKTARLCVASSSDLISWKKHGLAFTDNKYRDLWSKSGAIVCERRDNDVIAVKIKGKYYMYWGDTDIFMATSDDLIVWTPVTGKKGKLKPAMKPRPGYFDSRLVEPGPFALKRKDGILLIYNSANSAANGDKTLPQDTYAVGQALFSATTPGKLLARSNRHFMHPTESYELTGQVNNVCFLEGMVWFKGRWLLYYGTADSKIAVAECEEK